MGSAIKLFGPMLAVFVFVLGACLMEAFPGWPWRAITAALFLASGAYTFGFLLAMDDDNE